MSHHRKGSKRQARRASIERKRGAFYTWKTPANKKALPEGKAYAFDATRAPDRRPGSEPAAPSNGATSHEFCLPE